MPRRLLHLLVIAGAQGVLLAWAGNVLPSRVATTFGQFGAPVAFSSRSGFVFFSAVMMAVVVAVFAGARHLVRVAPERSLSLPRRDFWLHPDRVDATRAMLGDWLLGIGVLTAAFSLVVTYLVVRANLTEPVRLPNVFFLFLAAYLVLTLVGVAFLVMRLVRSES